MWKETSYSYFVSEAIYLILYYWPTYYLGVLPYIYIYIHILLLVCTNNFFSSTLTGCSLFSSELLSLEILTIGTSQLSLPSKSYRLLLPLKIIYDHLTITLRTSICTLRSVCSRVVSLQNTTTVSHYYPYSPL